MVSAISRSSLALRPVKLWLQFGLGAWAMTPGLEITRVDLVTKRRKSWLNLRAKVATVFRLKISLGQSVRFLSQMPVMLGMLWRALPTKARQSRLKSDQLFTGNFPASMAGSNSVTQSF
jgi:hypothetical protein